MNIPESTIKRLQEGGHSDSSIHLYRQLLRRLYKLVLPDKLDEPYDYKDIIALKNKVVQIIEDEVQSKASQASILNAIKLSIPMENKENIDFFKGHFIRIARTHTKTRQYAKPIAYKPLYQLHKKIYSNAFTYKEYIRYIVSSLYRYLPALRGQDFYSLIYKNAIIKDHYSYFTKHKYNYIDIVNHKIVIGNYKTKKLYGIRILNIPMKLRSIIQEWINSSSLTDGEPFIFNRNRRPFTKQSYTYLLYKIYGKPFSTNIIRRIYESEMINYMERMFEPERYIELRKKLADTVGHSLTVQEFTYSNNIYKLERSSDEYMKDIFSYFLEAIDI